MTKAQTPAQRKAAERARKKAAGLQEVRGIWLAPSKHTTAKEHCRLFFASDAPVVVSVTPVAQSVGGVGESAHPL